MVVQGRGEGDVARKSGRGAFKPEKTEGGWEAPTGDREPPREVGPSLVGGATWKPRAEIIKQEEAVQQPRSSN